MSASRMDLISTLGAAYFGLLISCMAFGFLTAQVYLYYGRYPHDKLEYKFLVLFLTFLETLDQTFIAYTVYYYSIINYNNPVVLLDGSVLWSILLQFMLGAVVGATVKTCSATRVWRFSDHNIPLTGVLLLLVVGQLAFAIAFIVKAFFLEKLADMGSLTLLASLALGLGVVTDVITAAALCYYLRKLRTGYAQCDTLANMLIRYAINTGLLTSIISFSTLILYNIMPRNFVFVGFYFVLCKMYGISLISTLNTRRCAQDRMTDNEQNPPRQENTSNKMKPAPSSIADDNQTKSQIEVMVCHESLFFYDPEHLQSPSYGIAC